MHLEWEDPAGGSGHRLRGQKAGAVLACDFAQVAKLPEPSPRSLQRVMLPTVQAAVRIKGDEGGRELSTAPGTA